MAELDQVVADLGYAAGAGAAALSAKVVADAQALAQLGRPGPGLRQGLAAGRESSASAQTSFATPAALAGHMAVQAADGGAALAVGKR